jgi:hypothetical protein
LLNSTLAPIGGTTGVEASEEPWHLLWIRVLAALRGLPFSIFEGSKDPVEQIGKNLAQLSLTSPLTMVPFQPLLRSTSERFYRPSTVSKEGKFAASSSDLEEENTFIRSVQNMVHPIFYNLATTLDNPNWLWGAVIVNWITHGRGPCMVDQVQMPGLENSRLFEHQQEIKKNLSSATVEKIKDENEGPEEGVITVLSLEQLNDQNSISSNRNPGGRPKVRELKTQKLISSYTNLDPSSAIVSERRARQDLYDVSVDDDSVEHDLTEQNKNSSNELPLLISVQSSIENEPWKDQKKSKRSHRISNPKFTKGAKSTSDSLPAKKEKDDTSSSEEEPSSEKEQTIYSPRSRTDKPVQQIPVNRISTPSSPRMVSVPSSDGSFRKVARYSDIRDSASPLQSPLQSPRQNPPTEPRKTSASLSSSRVPDAVYKNTGFQFTPSRQVIRHALKNSQSGNQIPPASSASTLNTDVPKIRTPLDTINDE